MSNHIFGVGLTDEQNAFSMSYLDNDRLKQVFFLLIILSLGGTLFWKFTGFIPAFLGAVTLYILTRPLLFYLVKRKRWKKAPAAILLILLSFIVFLVPVGLFVNMMTAKIGFAIQHSTELLHSLQNLIEKVKLSTRFDLLSAANIQKFQEMLTNFLPQFLGTTFNFLITMVIMYFILYFMLTQAEEMEELLYEYIPLKEENLGKLGKEVKSMVISNAIGIPMLGLVQAIFAVIGYWIFGIPDPVFWGVVTGFMSVLPVVGTAAVWIPMSVYLFLNGMTWQGIGMLVWGVLIISNLDNVFRFMWQKKVADVHPLITVFGVLIGIPLFGFVGLIFGPLVISLFLLLLKIYRDEFGVIKKQARYR